MGCYRPYENNTNQQKPCGAVAPVFDGRRRYDVALSYVKKTDVQMDNGLYQGPVLVCQIHYDQIAGYNRSVQAYCLVVTNGTTHYCYLIDREGRDYRFLERIPTYAELASGDLQVPTDARTQA